MWVDPNLSRKNNLFKKHLVSDEYRQADVPLFSLFEISVTGLCNRKCEFCPRADPAIYPNTAAFLSTELYEKIFSELSEIPYTGLVVYSGFSEPLYHKKLPYFLSYAKKRCPAARLEVYTNGDFLTAEKTRELYDAGMTSLHISLYDGPQQIEHFKKLQQDSGLPDEAVVLRERWYSREQGYGLTLSNRAGMIDFDALKVERLREPLKQNCFYPFYMMMVDHDGDVLLCSHDWGKKLVAGNLGKQHVLDVWNSDVMRMVRTRLTNRDRSQSPCNECDVQGMRIGLDHFKQWTTYYSAKGGAMSR